MDLEFIEVVEPWDGRCGGCGKRASVQLIHIHDERVGIATGNGKLVIQLCFACVGVLEAKKVAYAPCIPLELLRQPLVVHKN